MIPTRSVILALGLLACGPAAAAGLTIESRVSADEGPYIVDADGRTLYRFSKDNRGKGDATAKTACTGTCTNAWPPVLVDGEPAVAEAAQPGLVGTIRRPDGGLQATYAGWPLYRYAGDTDTDKASGQGVKSFGGEWHLVAAQPGAQQGEGGQTSAVSFEGLKLMSPECVRHDPARDRYLVSNINGKMLEADDNGFISVVTADGIAELKWISGEQQGVTLNAPKGMQIADDRLYVADIDHLRVFDAASGAPLRMVHVQGAKFLNDLAVAEDGTVFVTDSGTKDVPGAIWRVEPDGAVEKITEGQNLHRPNGIDFGPDGNLVVATFAGDQVMLISRTGEMLGSKTLDVARLDGLVVDGSTVLVSSWDGHRLVRVAPDGSTETLVTGLTQPACFDVDRRNGLLLIPQVKLDSVAVVPMGKV